MQKYRHILHSVLIQAGTLILSRREENEVIKEKEKNEIVTPADIVANKYIVKQLINNFPTIPIYTEEGKKDKSQNKTRWIVDPLDGTTPWVCGNSGFSISVALEENGKIIVGAVYDPVMKEFFYAEKGKGAFKKSSDIVHLCHIYIYKHTR